MIKKLIASLVSLAVLLAPLPAYSSEADLQGRVTSLSLDDPAPYSGVLLDAIAASKMLVDKKYLRIEIELQLRKEFQKDLAEKRMAYDLLKVDHDSLRKIHDQTIIIKEKQINDLNLMLKEEMQPEHTEWWLFGGVAVGIALSVLVFYASVEIAK